MGIRNRRLVSLTICNPGYLIPHPCRLPMRIFIKYMVSVRCIVLVKDELNKLGLIYTDLQLGSVDLLKNLTETNRAQLTKNLSESGLELHEDKKGILVEKIKHVLLAWVACAQDPRREKYSIHLKKTLKYEYNYLSNLFTEVEGISIQTFLIRHKVVLIKELLSYGKLNLSQIADLLNYSSSAHLSSQFKKITGISPSFFKNLKK